MELDWRNRCIAGERLEDLLDVVRDLDVADDHELYDKLWDEPHRALAFHRALLRVSAELLWQRAARLAPWHVILPADWHSLMREAFDEVHRRADIEFHRAGL